jgi:antitoxin ParD1/3/4
MPTRNVNLTDELDRFIAVKSEDGRYDHASEVVQAAVRTLERQEQEYEANVLSGSEGYISGGGNVTAEG